MMMRSCEVNRTNVVRLREGTASELLPESPFRVGATQRLRWWSLHGDGVKLIHHS